MDNGWKTKDCSMCNFCVDNECRELPPREMLPGRYFSTRYPSVVSFADFDESKDRRYLKACSRFVAKTEDQKPGDAL